MPIITALLPILIALGVGFLFGKQLPKRICTNLIGMIAPLIWSMLFLIGFEFGEVILSANAIGIILFKASIFALLSTLVPCALIAAVIHRTACKPKKPNTTASRWQSALPAIKESTIALGMVFLGAFLLAVSHHFDWALSLPNSGRLLLVLVVLVGIDLTQVKLDKSWLSRKILLVPALVIIGSFLAALPAAWLCGESIQTALGLVSGFGWFTLSSVLVGESLGEIYGTMALTIDLFRELLAIMLLYAVGGRHPQVSIGGAGATALDSTLPMIKQTCSAEMVPLALVSGFILTAIAPVLMTLFIN